MGKPTYVRTAADRPAESCEPVLTLQDVRKTIKRRTIVDGVNMTVKRGNVLALCGGNGAGKSTILRMIVGVLKPSGGSICVNGYRWADDRKAYSAQLGYMPDDYLFGQGLTAGETLSFWASLRKVSKRRTEETLAAVGLADVRNEQVRSFSKGMRQRLLFAQALLAEPPLLVMDEPTNGLDPFWMHSFVQLVQQLKSQGQAVVFSTHQLQIAEAVADDVVFLDRGRIVCEGKTAELKQSHGPAGLQAVFNRLYGFETE